MHHNKHKAEELEYKRSSVWLRMNTKERKEIFSFNEGYKAFLDAAKTEREAAFQIEQMAREHHFIPINDVDRLQPGSKVMLNYRNKAVMLAIIGKKPLERGCKILGSHTDAPRLDLKPLPLYEKEGLALLKTHYYGGVKKYQWLGIPLALHGVACRKDGTCIPVVIGTGKEDPVFTISDLLPHLAKDQMEKKMMDAVEGEGLNVIFGGIPLEGRQIKEPVKLALLERLNKDYGLAEEDFISAEFEVVPAWGARDVGLDSSMVGAYGQDDRVCVYTSLRAILETEAPDYTGVALFLDKEEIGSTGNTGMKARVFENFMAEIIERLAPPYGELTLRRCLANSRALSADVMAALDPNYPEVMERLNSSKMGHGVVLTKYTGSRGKVNTNDAHAEFVAYVKNLLTENNIPWQTGELGKVDQGGGGTIAHMMAAYGMDVLDCGVPVIGMHSPFEVVSKVDVYASYLAYKVFLEQ
ncbi:aminopeptidase [Desulfofalx alkaliphila]|uniref:aminopeptidase n=1 Tax=Desulfofalx alkaliphila TaxID=105483 RepID=UPI0004E0FA80|nr:aminopeptidase [Desulfofalx alkaliphila]